MLKKEVEKINSCFCFLLGSLLRVWLIRGSGLNLEDRVELGTPTNSWKRLKEGLSLWKSSQSPYEGVLFHEPPLVLHLFSKLTESLSENRLSMIFVLADLLTAFILEKLAKTVTERIVQYQKSPRFEADNSTLTLTPEQFQNIPRYTSLGYLFNPYIIANCGAKTTTVFSNLILSSFLLASFNKYRFLACFFLSLSAYHSFYTIMLIVPMALVLSQGRESFENELFRCLCTFFTFVGILLIASYELMGQDWKFLSSTYGFLLGAPELTPNIGLSWYFFTEMFEHFRLFFVSTFQLNIFLYLIPLTIKLKNSPYLLSVSLISIISIFKAYPSYGDVGFYLSLLPMLIYLVPFMKQLFIVVTMILVTSVLGPILFQLWIYNGSANANYFFAVNTAFGTAQIFLLTDILYAHVKREFYLENGLKFGKGLDGEPLSLAFR